jgi:DNA-directed RNA polymerase subunit RPC12/RpoP
MTAAVAGSAVKAQRPERRCRSMVNAENRGPVGALRCLGCGETPEDGQVKRRADGSACPHCAERLLESLPSLLPSRVPAPAGESDVLVHQVVAGPEPFEEAAAIETRGRARFTHLRGGTPPDLAPSPHQPSPVEPA